MIEASDRAITFSLLIAVAAAGLACGEKPGPAPAAPPPAASPSSDLEPLSAHGSAPSSPAASAENTAPPALPPGHPPLGANAAPPSGDKAATETGTVEGTIDVAPKLAGQVKGGAIFVIARKPDHQIAAVRREEVTTFPVSFRLSSADVMMEGVTFSGPFDITARWSQKGDAMPASGDIEGVARGVAMGARGVKIRLTDVRP